MSVGAVHPDASHDRLAGRRQRGSPGPRGRRPRPRPRRGDRRELLGDARGSRRRSTPRRRRGCRAAARARSRRRSSPPVRPGKIVCLGYNYRGHVPDGADPTAAIPSFPMSSSRRRTSSSGPPTPSRSRVVRDRRRLRGRDRDRHRPPGERRVARDGAGSRRRLHAVQRRVRRATGSGARASGRSASASTPSGRSDRGSSPRDEIADPHDLLVEVVRDGVVTVSQSTSTMIFSMAYLVHYLSKVMTLEPGDVISTGTPQKLPEAHAAHRALAHGDAVTIRVAGHRRAHARRSSIRRLAGNRSSGA